VVSLLRDEQITVLAQSVPLSFPSFVNIVAAKAEIVF
jgi:hypothetical protein